MNESLFKICLFAATALTGLLCGASLDQSIKQLPSRHIIGTKEFSAFAKAADLKNGIIWYAILGIGSALFSIISAILVLIGGFSKSIDIPVYISALSAIGQLICTSQAAPTYFKQKKTNEEATLKKIFYRFEKIQTIRSIFICTGFISVLWALYICVTL